MRDPIEIERRIRLLEGHIASARLVLWASVAALIAAIMIFALLWR